MAKQSFETVVTPVGQVLFPNFAEPSTVKVNGQPTGKPQYSASLLLGPDQVGDLKAAILRLAKESFPETKPGQLQLPIHGGDKEAQKAADKGRDGEFYRGRLVLKARSDFKPVVVGPDNQKLLDYGSIKSGDFGRLQVTLKAYDVNGSRGVKAFLNGFMLDHEGERMFGADPQAGFAEYASKETAAPFADAGSDGWDSPVSEGSNGVSDDDNIPF